MPVQDVPGNAQAGVKGANRRFATVTPNPFNIVGSGGFEKVNSFATLRYFD